MDSKYLKQMLTIVEQAEVLQHSRPQQQPETSILNTPIPNESFSQQEIQVLTHTSTINGM